MQKVRQLSACENSEMALRKVDHRWDLVHVSSQWGAAATPLALSAREHPYRCLIELSLPVLLLLLLSTMAWIWLGGKKEDDING